METSVNEISINGVAYVRKDQVKEMPVVIENMVIIRTQNAGVFMGELVSRDGQEVELKNARRLWMWYGAASLSQLAMEGVSRPRECKFPVAVSKIVLTQVIEIIQCTAKALASVQEVPVWKA